MPLIAEHDALRRLCEPAGPGQARELLPVAQRSAAPPPPLGLAALAGAIPGRRSVREFADRPVSADLLAGACQAGTDLERARWPAVVHGDPGLGIAAAVWSVTGLARGIYRYLPEGRQFAPTADGKIVGELRSSYAAAPALLLVFGELDRARGTCPQEGYQRLLVRAGALGYAALLAALSAGLCGCPFGGASIGVSQLLRDGPNRPHHLFTVAVGWLTD
jgi:hypothetical protein